MGDLADYVAPGDWRWKQEEKDEELIAKFVDKSDVAHSEIRRVIQRIEPIADKVIGAIQGNHELAMRHTFNQNVHKQLCEDLGIKNLGYMALVRLQFDWQRNGTSEHHAITIMLHHGWGGGRSDGADLSRFNDLVRDYEADWFVAGHTHRKIAARYQRHYLDQAGQIGFKPVIVGRSGTYLKTLMQSKNSYAELGAYRPLATGCLRISYCPNKQDAIANI